jgi:hypothetical protein
MRRISDEEWPELFGSPMQRVSRDEEPPFDFWPYFEKIPQGDFNGHDCSEGRVECVYRHPTGRLEHVLVNSNDHDVFMVIVLDRVANSVVGHHLLDLLSLYESHVDDSCSRKE